MKREFLIFLPTYNESGYIKTIINKIRFKYPEIDVLVINDGSTDDTKYIIDHIPEIYVINHTTNKGYGYSLIEGFKYAVKWQYRYLITIDGDLQHDPEEIKAFIRATSYTDADIISGSRLLHTTNKQLQDIPNIRYRINQRITRYINRLTNHSITDAFCGFKLYKVSALSDLNLTETGYGFPLQFWFEADRRGLGVKEIPVKLIYNDYSRNFKEKFDSALKRYKYYITIIQKELHAYEYHDYSSAS